MQDQDKELPRSTGGGSLPPLALTSDQKDMCNRLDDLHTRYGLKIKPSDMFRGAVFAARKECRSNPDWVSQAANSLREILYPFWSAHVNGVDDRKTEAFKKYGSVYVNDTFTNEVGRLYGLLNNLAHHGATSPKFDFSTFSIEDFDQLLIDFERVMCDALTRQIDVHAKIDEILESMPQ